LSGIGKDGPDVGHALLFNLLFNFFYSQRIDIQRTYIPFFSYYPCCGNGEKARAAANFQYFLTWLKTCGVQSLVRISEQAIESLVNEGHHFEMHSVCY